MKYFYTIGRLIAILVFVAGAAHFTTAAEPPASKPTTLPDRVNGKADAPIKVEEFVSFTCPHCAEFYTATLPVLEKRYVETGKVKFILRDFVMDHAGLHAAVLARCMPAEQYYPFVKILYGNQMAWAMSSNPDAILISYAKLGGLPEDQAKACLQDNKMIDAVVAERTDADQKYQMEATPTFIVNDGAETIKGAQSADEFEKVFDRLLAAKK